MEREPLKGQKFDEKAHDAKKEGGTGNCRKRTTRDIFLFTRNHESTARSRISAQEPEYIIFFSPRERALNFLYRKLPSNLPKFPSSTSFLWSQGR